MELIRKRIYKIIEASDGSNIESKAYDIFMMITIIVSIIPLCFLNSTSLLLLLDKITAGIFIVDYMLRLSTADLGRENNDGKLISFITYPFRPMAIIDLLSILPSVICINSAFKLLKLFRLMRTLRVFKFFRYSKNIQIIKSVIVNKKDALLTVGVLAFAYIFVSALVVFQVEPDTFGNLFKAIYWATVSLTTVGYGDIYPVSDIGKFISMISSFFGIAIIALPSGIIISGYQEVIESQK